MTEEAVFVLPKILRDKMNLRVGDTVTIIDEGLPDYRLLSVVAGISEDDRKINISTISDLANTNSARSIRGN